MMQILAFHPMELELRSFADMPSHMQTEMVLLAMERGSPVSDLASALGVHAFDVMRIAKARHLHALHSIGASPFGDAPRSARRIENRPDKIDVGDIDLSQSQLAVLRWIAGSKRRQVSARRADMAQAAGVAAKSLDLALLALLDIGLLSRLRIASKSKPAIWAVTERGLSILASLEPGAAA